MSAPEPIARYDATSDLLDLTRLADPRLRCSALDQLGSGLVELDRADVWGRLGEMATDSDVRVRRRVLRLAGEAGPLLGPEEDTGPAAVIGAMVDDPDPKIRRRAQKALGLPRAA